GRGRRSSPHRAGTSRVGCGLIGTSEEERTPCELVRAPARTDVLGFGARRGYLTTILRRHHIHRKRELPMRAMTGQGRVAAQSGTFQLGGDRPVVRLGFGAMRITGPGIWGPPRDHAESIRVLRRAVALGVNFIDTADSYGPYISEELIHEALYPYPTDLV